MPTIVRLAKTTGELNDVLEMRFRALKESGRESGSFGQLTGKILDQFDIYPTTLNVLAYESGKAVAGLRAVEYRPQEKLLNLVFNFQESIEKLKGKVFLLDMLALTESLKSSSSVKRDLVRMLLMLLAQREVRHCFFVCPLDVLPEVEGVGFKRLQEPFESEDLEMNVVPLVLDLEAFYHEFIARIKDQEILRFQEVFYYTIFAPGEVLVVEGEKGSTAYLIDSGEVDVLIRKGEEILPISTISEGRMIGEVAMVTNEPRTASLIAKRETSCISFDRQDFMRLMYDQPHKSMDIFKIFSKRLNESNKRLAELKS